MVKAILRAGLGFLAGAAGVIAVAVLPFLVIDSTEKIHGLRAVRNVLTDEAIALGFFYLWALKLALLFGVPVWLVLRWRRWHSMKAYAIAGAIASEAGLAGFFVILRPPLESWLWLVVIGIAVAGVVGGLTFRAIAKPQSGQGPRGRTG
jgi:hypothetical protein